eukprot:GHRR01005955.1.p1 GENE.GHRR01005955.1~~GHRR01005955.1.p1  ORF type:complete len:222 (-),score=42.93 GHRR01005955.1:1131-1796(-)
MANMWRLECIPYFQKAWSTAHTSLCHIKHRTPAAKSLNPLAHTSHSWRVSLSAVWLYLWTAPSTNGQQICCMTQQYVVNVQDICSWPVQGAHNNSCNWLSASATSLIILRHEEHTPAAAPRWCNDLHASNFHISCIVAACHSHPQLKASSKLPTSTGQAMSEHSPLLAPSHLLQAQLAVPQLLLCLHAAEAATVLVLLLMVSYDSKRTIATNKLRLGNWCS